MFYLYIAVVLISTIIAILYDGYLTRLADAQASDREREARNDRKRF
jgi:hypothetical protein